MALRSRLISRSEKLKAKYDEEVAQKPRGTLPLEFAICFLY